MTDCCSTCHAAPILPYTADADPASIPCSPVRQSSDIASCADNPLPSPTITAAAADSASAPSASASSSSSSFSPRYALARRRRECLGLVESLRLSMNLSLKALTLLFCCVLMTLQYRAQQRRRAASAPSSDEHQQSSSSTSSSPSSSASSAFSSLFSSTSKSATPSLYQRLGVPSDATSDQIRAAHRRMAMRYHPDKVLAAHCSSATSAPVCPDSSGSDIPSHDMFIAMQEAYEVLSDEFERKRYDYSLLTGTTYTRLPSGLRNVDGRADRKQPEQQMAPFPAYIRRRPAAFTSTAHSADFRDSQRDSSRSTSSSSSAASSTSSTPQRVRSSRSFSSIFTSPFLHVSPAPSTASATGTGSPPYHSPASSPSTPPTSPGTSFPFLPSPATTPAAAPSSAAATAHSDGGVAAVWRWVAELLVAVREFVGRLIRWWCVGTFVIALFPVRVALALAVVVKERRKRMEEETEAYRRRMRDEARVCMYDGCG